MAEAVAFTTFDHYLEGERASQRRHELVAGRLYALAGGSERHDLVAGLLYRTLAPGAETRGCRPFTSNRLVRTECGNGYYHDRREKAIAYAESSGLQLLLLVDPDRRRIEVTRPAGGRIRDWRAYGPGQVVMTPYGNIDVDALYEAPTS